jgi:hypothetical protein
VDARTRSEALHGEVLRLCGTDQELRKANKLHYFIFFHN